MQSCSRIMVNIIGFNHLTKEQKTHVAAELEFYVYCVQHGIITIDEYIEMSDCYLFPLIRSYGRSNRKV